MLSAELRRRLEELARQAPTPPRPEAPSPPAATLRLDELPHGGERRSPLGPHFALRRSLQETAPDLGARLAHWQRLADRSDYLSEPHPEIEAFLEHFPERLLILDLETCGFAGSPIFLVGLLYHTPDGFVCDQLLARDYSEEHAMLESLWEIAADKRVLVTFNGKSFDWPMVEDRTRFHRFRRVEPLFDARPAPLTRQALVSPPRPERHFDLLHHARRQWKRLLPDCKLQTLERFVCRRMRRGDLPGAMAPAAYHRFVRSGDAREIAPVLEHNLLDLITLAQVALAVAAEGERRALAEPPPKKKGRGSRQGKNHGPKIRSLVDCDGGVASRIAQDGQC